MPVFSTDNGDGSADFTVSIGGEDYKFSAVADENIGLVQYEETLSWGGVVRVSEPPQSVFKELMVSDEMAEWLDSEGLDGVRRQRR